MPTTTHNIWPFSRVLFYWWNMCDVRNKYTKWIKIKYKKKMIITEHECSSKITYIFRCYLPFACQHRQEVLLLWLFILKINICFVNASNLIWPFWWHLHTLHFIRVLHFVHISALLSRLSPLALPSQVFLIFIPSNHCPYNHARNPNSTASNNNLLDEVFSIPWSRRYIIWLCVSYVINGLAFYLERERRKKNAHTKTNWFWEMEYAIFTCAVQHRFDCHSDSFK